MELIWEWSEHDLQHLEYVYEENVSIRQKTASLPYWTRY